MQVAGFALIRKSDSAVVEQWISIPPRVECGVQADGSALLRLDGATSGWNSDTYTIQPYTWTVPDPPPPTPQQVAAGKLAKGIAITSTGTPTLNATYALDAPSQMNINGVVTYLDNNGNTFPPAKAATLNYPDATGAFHTFSSAAQFIAFATACADAITQICQGGSPTQAATIL